MSLESLYTSTIMFSKLFNEVHDKNRKLLIVIREIIALFMFIIKTQRVTSLNIFHPPKNVMETRGGGQNFPSGASTGCPE